ncbi:MAG: DEAD/DEAH box helicase, partial [Planctomycetales bacterium]|nr:DEAD/DEAH box helicase [Planctomycetales bacterium]
MTTLDELEARIDAAMQIDRHRLGRQARSIRGAMQAQRPFDRELAKFTERLEQSIARREKRQTQLPPRIYDPALPISAAVEQISEAIQRHRAIVVCGETGSGKSTQLPKICLDAGRGVDGLIGHTQPRRIAARSIAARLTDELQSACRERGVATDASKFVGYKVRFTDTTQADAYVKLMTDGILLAETQNDRFLDQYDTIIVDEAHERTLNIDFLLGFLHRLLRRRRDLRVIVTSATLDAERFSRHFAFDGQSAPIVEVSGRGYPVDVRYRPLEQNEDGDDVDLPRGIADAASELVAEGPGDMLVFLPTERDIRDVSKVLRGRTLGGGAEIVPLYARLSTQEQNKVFQPHKGRRIVLATNVAESS